MKKIILFQIIFVFCFSMAFPQTRNQKIKVTTKQNIKKESDAKLLYEQACDLYNGTNGKLMDREKAISLYKQSADMGYSVAQYELGRLYIVSSANKEPVYTNKEEALDYLKKSAIQKNPNALRLLYHAYYYGMSVPQDYAQAAYWIRIGVDLEDPACIYSLGLEYQTGKMVEKDYQKAFYLIKKAANLNYVDAYEMVGYCYLNGWGTEKNINEAKQWYRKGAEKEDSDCQTALADFYAQIEKDGVQAYYWYRKAAEKGDAYSQYKVGLCYDCAIGNVEKNTDEAIKWYKKSAEQGYGDAQFNLAESLKGINPSEAFYWYKKAYEKGNLDAGAEIGMMLYGGRGCTEDKQKSIEILQNLSQKGNARAMASYGEKLIYGVPGILKKNKSKGIELIREAARTKEPFAEFVAGMHNIRY